MRIKRSPFKAKAKGSYRIENKTDKEATIYIYDEIGWFGVEASVFAKDMEALEAETIHIRMNTPGGNVFDGTAMANIIKQHKSHTIIHIDGLAASIGSIIALAGDETYMAENAFFMFHEAWTITIGNADNLREDAKLLDKIDGVLANTYAQKTGKEEKDIKKLMRAETWLTADEALEMGMIDGIEKATDEKAKTIFDLSVFANVPDQLKGEKQIPTARDLERILRDAGCSAKQAKEILAGGLKDDQRDVDLIDDPPAPIQDVQRDVEPVNQRDVDNPELEKKKKDRTAELLTKGEEFAPTRHAKIKEVLER